ncbi:MAG: glycosyltransferase family 4 protein [Actinobacteria bacterium]|nr:glycosyltransferase family 4 protein [Actinomycetota bacterium]MBV9933844.1 glycosyltransferase family 4 protein [Actinomycetota bacterium]
MKIAYVSPLHFDGSSYVGGGERYPLNLARGVAADGTCTVELVSYGPQAARRELAPGVTLRVLPGTQPAHPLDVSSWDLVDALRDADLVHVHQVFTRGSEIAVLVARQLHKPICVTDHGGGTTRRLESSGALALADAVVAYSDFGASLVRATIPTHVIKGGVDAAFFTPPTAGTRDRVLFVGRWLPHKGIETLVDALPAGVRLTICGQPYSDDYTARLRAQVDGRGIAAHVEFVSDRDDDGLRELYRRAYAVVLPSMYEDAYGNTYLAPELMGFSLLEGMACGAPAVCSRVGAMPEFVRHGETGFVFDTRDELHDVLQRLAVSPDLVAAIGRAGRASAEAFDLHVAGGRMRALYEELVAARRAA